MNAAKKLPSEAVRWYALVGKGEGEAKKRANGGKKINIESKWYGRKSPGGQPLAHGVI